MKYKDYYEVMGVGRDASADEIKRAYRRLARKYHPDVSKEPNAEERFKEIGEANEVLHDPEKRAAYDNLGKRHAGEDFQPPPNWHFDFESGASGAHSEFFEDLFGGLGARAGRGRFRRRGFDTAVRLQITLEEAFHGAERTLSLQRMERAEDGRMQPRAEQINIKIPAGVTEGQQLRVPAHGEPGVGGEAPGDLFAQIHIVPHRWFRVEGRDVSLDLPITPWEAALGGTVRVPTLAGKVDLKIPKGAQTDQQLRLRGRGLPGSPAGDQLVVLKIVAPPAKDAADEALYKEMAARLTMNPRQALEG